MEVVPDFYHVHFFFLSCFNLSNVLFLSTLVQRRSACPLTTTFSKILHLKPEETQEQRRTAAGDGEWMDLLPGDGERRRRDTCLIPGTKRVGGAKGGDEGGREVRQSGRERQMDVGWKRDGRWGGSDLMRKQLCWRRFEDHQQLQPEERCRGAPGEPGEPGEPAGVGPALGRGRLQLECGWKEEADRLSVAPEHILTPQPFAVTRGRPGVIRPAWPRREAAREARRRKRIS